MKLKCDFLNTRGKSHESRIGKKNREPVRAAPRSWTRTRNEKAEEKDQARPKEWVEKGGQTLRASRDDSSPSHEEGRKEKDRPENPGSGVKKNNQRRRRNCLPRSRKKRKTGETTQ